MQSGAPEILDRLRQAFRDASVLLDADFVLAEQVLFADIGSLDSVSRMRLLMTIEHAFSLQISARENSQLETIGNLVELIQLKQKRRE